MFRRISIAGAAVVIFLAPLEARAQQGAFAQQQHRAFAPGSPECGTMLAMGAMEGFGDVAWLFWVGFASAVVPQTGLHATLGPHRAPVGAILSWPASIPFGPAFATKRRSLPCAERVDTLRLHRVVVEPGVAFGAPSRSTSDGAAKGFVRVGYRAMLHPEWSVVGIGLGVGSTVELFAPAREPAPRPSLGGELVFHLGRCCEPGYLNVVARYDRFFAGDERARDVVSASVGLAFF